MPCFEHNDKFYTFEGSMSSTKLNIILESVEISEVIKELIQIQSNYKLKPNENLFVTFDEYGCELGVVIGRAESS